MGLFRMGSEESEPFIYSENTSLRKRARPCFLSKEVVIVQWIIILALLATIITRLRGTQCDERLCLPANRFWSPAEDVITYQNTVFDTGDSYETTKYYGHPSPEVDEAWKELYRYGISRITKDEARKMHNKTVPIPGDTGHYIVGLDVFHQLHCLNMLRKRLWTANRSLAEEESDEIEHVEHCIQSARQYIMCTADISPIVWEWDTQTNTSRPVVTIYHTCRNFDAVHAWAKEHTLESFDPYTYVEDDL